MYLIRAWHSDIMSMQIGNVHKNLPGKHRKM